MTVLAVEASTATPVGFEVRCATCGGVLVGERRSRRRGVFWSHLVLPVGIHVPRPQRDRP